MIPNMTVQGDGFYVSYNPIDVASYGDRTTALVPNDMSNFYILNGNHLDAYRQRMSQGFKACLDYFLSQPDCRSKFSDEPPH